MITCHIRYVIDATKLKEFEHFGRLWIPITNRLGGTHHGYLLPAEGANNIAMASFTFPSLAKYEEFRTVQLTDPECQAAFKYAADTKCWLSHERTFFRPVFE